MDSCKNERCNWVHKANDEEEEHDEGDLLEEVLVAALVLRKVDPILVRHKLTIFTITVVRISTLGYVGLEVLLVLFTKLFLDASVVKDSLTLAAGTEAD